jgi:spore coat protein CotH
MQEPVNQQTKEYVPASFWFYNGAVSQTFDIIGVRIKGGASRGFSKKSFKLSLNEYEDYEWAQQKKIALKAMQMDPSATREKLTQALLYSMNAVAQRNSYAELFINDQFMGMYLIQEDIGNQVRENCCCVLLVFPKGVM